jgi:glycosyltransferase involved in cell wall biosynthesis
MARLMRDAVGLVYPSQAEGFGLPPLEAMQVGCPVVTTRQTALPYTCGKAAYYVDTKDPHSLTIALQRLEREPELRNTLIELGHERLTQFSWHRSASIFLEALLGGA